jgi:eukaryotic-like serine/threonine-protein kinase
MSLEPGQSLSHYRVVNKLGAGGMGEVYLAVDSRLGREVALKVVLPGADVELLRRFRREARAIAALRHPHIAVLLDVGEEAENFFLVMELVHGEPLNRALDWGAQPWERLAELGLQLASALDHAHASGVLHRDIKPGNIILSPGRGAVLLDFGVAQWMPSRRQSHSTEAPTDVAQRLSQVGSIAGTTAYLSPEQVSGGTLDGRSDLFQLGVVLYEAACGRHPFEGPTAVDTQHAILRSPVPALSDVAGVPQEFSRIVEKLLEKDPDRRYAEARALEIDLQALSRDSAADAVPLVAAAGRRRRPGGTARRLVSVGAVAIAIGLIAWLGWRWATETPSLGPPARIVPFTHGEGDDASPAFSPDGDSIAFASERGGNWDLWVKLITGGAPVQVTHTPQVESQPSWSPDGARMVFVRREAEGSGGSIYVMPALGGDAHKLVTDAVDPAWSPDGAWIAYADTSGGWTRIMRVAVEGSVEPSVLTGREEGFFHRRPAWSPDGRTIVFNRSPGGWVGQLMRVSVFGGAAEKITGDPEGTVNLAAAVTPDGRHVVHTSDRGGAVNLWQIPLRGGVPERITSGPGRDMSATISPDGERIIFVNQPLGSSRILTVSPGGGQSVVLAEFHGSDSWSPDLSPDEAWILFCRKVPGTPWEMVLMPAAGGTPRTVLDGLGDVLWARFHPREDRIYFGALGAEGGRIGSVRPDGTGLAWITDVGVDAAYPDLSPDGESLAYVRNYPGGAEVVTRSLADGVERVLTADATLPAFSLDGVHVAVARSRSYEGGVGIVEIATGEVRWLSPSGSWPTWLPDGQLVYADEGEDGNQRAWSVAPDGGEAPRLLGSFRWDGAHYPFSVHPSSGMLLTTDSPAGTSTLWMAEF